MPSSPPPRTAQAGGPGPRARLLLALAGSAAIQAVVVLGHAMFDPEATATLHRITLFLGGDFLAGGYIQFFTLTAFLWGALHVRQISAMHAQELGLLSSDLLPTEPHVVLGPDDVNQIRLRAQHFLDARQTHASGHRHLFFQLVQKACVKFRANESAEAAFQIVESQSRIDRDQTETAFSPLRYLLWAIPSIGFVGTPCKVVSVKAGGVPGCKNGPRPLRLR